jgi:hypothetical protein
MGTLSTVTRYIKQVAGVLTEQAPLITSAGAGDADKIPALDATGRLDASFMPVGIAADTKLIVASEALAAGDFVNVYNNAGTANCRKADASAAGKEAHGFVLAAVSSSANATVYFEGANTQCTGLTAGNVYLSAATAGKPTNTAPSATGQVVQRLGLATSATEVNTEMDAPIVLA